MKLNETLLPPPAATSTAEVPSSKSLDLRLCSSEADGCPRAGGCGCTGQVCN